MDTVQTAVSKEDALLKDMDENNAVGDALVESKTTACATGDNADSMPALDNAIVGSGKVAGLHIAAPSDSETTDDLLEKIEEVVKDEESNGEIAVDKAIAESSEQDFLKQLEEAEAEAKALREKNISQKTEEKSSIDLTEESVSSSDEKEKAGNAIAKDIVDEPDRAHVADDNAADSTNVELIENKKSEPIRVDSIDSDVEFVPSESNDKTDPEGSDVVEITQSEINAESLKASTKKSVSDEPLKLDGEVRSLENGEIDLTNAEDSENSSEKDEVEITPNEAESVADVVSSSGEGNAEIVEPEKIEESAESESQEVEESKEDNDSEKNCEAKSLEPTETSEAQSKEVEDVISVESGTSEEEQTIKASAVETDKVSEEVSQTPESAELKISDAQRMSVDESPEVVDTMDVDEEEKMDVDMVETISDEEMPVATETKPVSEDQKQSEESDVIASSEAEAAPEPDTPTTKPENVTSSENEAPTTKETASKDEISSEVTSNIEKEAEESNPPAIEPEETELPSTEEVNDPEPDSAEHEEENVASTEVTNVPEDKEEAVEKTEVTTNEKEEAPTKSESKTDESVENVEKTSEITLTVDSAKEALEESKPLPPAIENETSEVTTTEKDSIVPLEQNTSISKVEKIEKDDKADKSVKLSDFTSIVTEDVDEKVSQASEKKQEDIVKLGCSKPENKLLTNAMKHGGSVTSLENSPVAASSANVFNSTPILRQFDISSENVSKISEAHGDASRTAEDHNLTTEEGTGTSSKTEEETGTTSNSDATHQTTDSVTKFLNVINKQYNGTTSEDSDVSTAMAKVPQDKSFAVMSSDLLSKAFESCPKTSKYEISVWYDEHDIRFLSVEKLEPKKTVNTMDSTGVTESYEKLSSNGSVSSLPQFSLGNRTSAMLSGSSTSSKTPDGKPNVSTAKHSQYTATGVVDLCKFMIEEFTKIKNKYEPPTTPTSSKASPETHKEEPSTPKGKVTGSSKKAVSKGKSASPQENETETPTKKADKRTLKRALTKSQSDDEEESKPKQTKQGKPQSATSKTQDTPSKSVAETSSLYCCLAKWVDKKYYAGRVTEEKAGNKFVVLFEDGASKILPRESIVFGEGDTLPLKDHSVHALLDDDYELGIVKAIDKSGEKVMYTVDIDGKEIKVSASDIYLTDQQAKSIQNPKDSSSTPSSNKNAIESPTEKSSPSAPRSTRKRPATSPITPEAGFSGGLTKRGGRKPKSS